MVIQPSNFATPNTTPSPTGTATIQTRSRFQSATPTSRGPARPTPVAAAPAAGPSQLSESQVAFINRPNPDYPVRARRAGQQGQTMVKFLIETSGRPSQVSVDKSSGYPDLDAAAVSGVKAALLRPYTENGIARPIWAVVAITFKLN